VLDTDKYASKLEALQESFKERFSEFVGELNNVALFTSPFTFPQENLSTLDQAIQLEVNMQNNSVLKGRFDELPPIPTASDMISFWRMLPATEFVHLRVFAQRYICRFGSTYRCEQSFSSMTLIKNRYRASLTDSHLNSFMLFATTELQPDIEKLVDGIQLHKSH